MNRSRKGKHTNSENHNSPNSKNKSIPLTTAMKNTIANEYQSPSPYDFDVESDDTDNSNNFIYSDW